MTAKLPMKEIQRREPDGSWLLYDFESLKTGDVFRVVSGGGHPGPWVCECDPYPVPDQLGNFATKVHLEPTALRDEQLQSDKEQAQSMKHQHE